MGSLLNQTVPDALRDAAVVTQAGDQVSLGSLFEGHPTLLLFVRHFGCIGCSQHVGELAPRLLELDRLGVKTVIVGNGDPGFMADFLERHDLADKRATLVVDPDLSAYRGAQLKRSFWATFGPRAVYEGLRARGRGYEQYRGSGDDLQQGGTLVIDGSGKVMLHYANESLGDRADLGDVVDVALGLAVRNRTDDRKLI